MKMKFCIFFNYLILFYFMSVNSLINAQTFTLTSNGTGGTATYADVPGIYIQSGTYESQPYYIKVNGTGLNNNVSYLYYSAGYWTIYNSLQDINYWYYWNNGNPVALPSGSNWSDQAGSVAGTFGPTSSQNTIANITFSDGSGYIPPAVTLGTNNNPIGRFRLTGSSVGGVLQSVTIALSGTYSGVNPSGVKLWSSTSNSFNAGSATLLCSKNNGASVAFNNFNSLVDNTSGTYYFITVDLAAGALGNITSTIPNQASFTFAGANNPGAFTNAPLASGGAPLPVELQNFTAVPQNGKVILKWNTATELNNYGFEIEKSLVISQQSLAKWEKVGFVAGAGNSNSPKEYSYIDNTTINGKNIYRLKQIDNDGKFEYSNEVGITVNSVLENFSVEQNVPNPCNPSTNIKFNLPKDGKVVLKVYNILGKEIATLFDENTNAGSHTIKWYGKDASGRELSSGVYLYNVSFDGQSVTKKMLLIR